MNHRRRQAKSGRRRAARAGRCAVIGTGARGRRAARGPAGGACPDATAGAGHAVVGTRARGRRAAAPGRVAGAAGGVAGTGAVVAAAMADARRVGLVILALHRGPRQPRQGKAGGHGRAHEQSGLTAAEALERAPYGVDITVPDRIGEAVQLAGAAIDQPGEPSLAVAKLVGGRMRPVGDGTDPVGDAVLLLLGLVEPGPDARRSLRPAPRSSRCCRSRGPRRPRRVQHPSPRRRCSGPRPAPAAP